MIQHNENKKIQFRRLCWSHKSDKRQTQFGVGIYYIHIYASPTVSDVDTHRYIHICIVHVCMSTILNSELDVFKMPDALLLFILNMFSSLDVKININYELKYFFMFMFTTTIMYFSCEQCTPRIPIFFSVFLSETLLWFSFFLWFLNKIFVLNIFDANKNFK